MTDDEFWSLIELLAPSRGALDAGQLGASLRQLDDQGISSFEEHLTAAVSALQTPEHRAQIVLNADDPSDTSGLAADDIIEDVAFAVVATGRERWTEVVRDPEQLAAAWPLESTDQVLTVVKQAFEQITGNPWIWAFHVHEAEVVPEPDAPRRVPWLGLHASFEDLRFRPEIDWRWVARRIKPYEERILWLHDQLATFDRIGPRISDLRPTPWSEWWTHERGPAALVECWIKFDLRAATTRHTVRLGKSWNAAELITARSVYPHSELERPPAQMADLAVQHTSEVLGRVVKRLKMAEPPPLPTP